MKVLQVMTKDVRHCKSSESLAECSRKMSELDVGSMPVVDPHGNLAGIITDRDITIRAVANDVDVSEAPVGDYVSTPVITVSPELEIEEASALMSEKQIRRLPVLDNEGVLIGIITLGDLALSIDEQKVGHALHEVSQHVKGAIA